LAEKGDVTADRKMPAEFGTPRCPWGAPPVAPTQGSPNATRYGVTAV